MQEPATDEVLIRREGRAGRITMNRPQALNALTLAMVDRIWNALLAWRSDPAVELILLDGAGDRGLCAGGDVRALYDSRQEQGSTLARTFWRNEYPLNALIGRYPKPYVAIQDGIVMGGGIGLSAHAPHRIVTERSRLAMPETGIGLIPDVGGTWLLAHAPGAVGVYLGLTGEAMRAADAIYARFADAFIPSAKIGRLVERLVDASGGPVEEAIRALAEDAGAISVDADRVNPPMVVARATQDRGADVVIEAVGAPSAYETSVDIVRRGGRVVVVGMYAGEVTELQLGVYWTRGLDVRFAGLCPTHAYWERTMALLAEGRLDPSPIVSHRLSLEEAPRGYVLFDRRLATKVLLAP